MGNEPIRVLIVDDIEATRDNLAKLLFFTKSIEVVGLAASGEEAISKNLQLLPDVILLDLTLADRNSFAVLDSIVEQTPSVRFILVTTAKSIHYLPAALSSAAAVLLVKPITTETLITAIKSAQKR